MLEIRNMKNRKLTFSENITTGAIAAITEVCVSHPLFTLKNRIQCGYPLSFKPQVLYRGVLGNATSMIPLVALQVSISDFLIKTIAIGFEIKNEAKQFTASFIAGVLSSIIAVPTELILVQQQRLSKNFLFTGKLCVNNYGVLKMYTGFLGTAIRTGFVSAGFLALTPQFKTQIIPFFEKEKIASLIAGGGAGLITALLSHPFDTIKTLQQAKIAESTLSFVKTARDLFKKESYFDFFKGFSARATRVSAATIILAETTEAAKNHIICNF